MDKSVLITGANGGLGRIITRKFLENQFSVTGIVSPSGDKDFLQNKKLSIYTADLANEADAEISLKKAIDESGPVSFGIFTVGGFDMGSLEDTGIEGVRQMIKLNFETAYNSARILLNHFRKSGTPGRMVFVGSIPGLHLKKAREMVAYGLSKSLVIGLAEIINSEGAEDNISAAVVIPSTIDTPQTRKAMPKADFSKWVTPEEIADSLLYLFSAPGMKLKDPVLKLYGKS